MKIAFLDRDGVINKFPGNGLYVTKVKDFEFLPGTLEAIKKLTDEGFEIFVISNQAGVGKGVYSNKKLKMITDKMLRSVRKAGGRISKVFYCTHMSAAGCDCRKPEIGHIHKALDLINKRLKDLKETNTSFFVGDTESDIKTGHNAGCKTIFALSGREDRRNIRKWLIKPDYIVKDLLEATELIISKTQKRKKS